MKVALMQPYIFPYIGYFQLINSVDKFIIYDDVNYIKQGWINRNQILLNKQKAFFTVPLLDASSFKPIREVEINKMHYTKWRKKFFVSLEHAYKKAPHYSNVIELLNKTLTEEEQFISLLAVKSIRNTCLYLNINTEIVNTSSDYGNSHLHGPERVIDICLKEKATHYINPIGGKDLYSKENFAENNILLSFIKTSHIKYLQSDNEFVPWLSIIDVMMFNSIEVAKCLLTKYSLV
jgi:hypothetical protein